MIIIGLSTNRDVKNGSDCMPKDYVLSVIRAGALPLILPMIPEDDPQYDAFLDKIIDTVDGLVFTGGPDIDPVLYNEAQLPVCHSPVSERDRIDMALIRKALSARKPFLGICRGLQVCNVALGGTLYQDVQSQIPQSGQHEMSGHTLAHQVDIVEGTLLNGLVKTDCLPVNSRHHQAVKQLADGLIISARSSEDGVVEAIEFEDGRPALCLQWHPENLAGQDHRHQALFDWLVREAGKKQRENRADC
ncbi:MAG: gamma-glutamyl-gamma-aminobutyrate hydrolase family protein [Christensenellales bacterium]|jgi:gamma-glutamyl-gamma-aminobutyrate hydrolase PuuD